MPSQLAVERVRLRAVGQPRFRVRASPNHTCKLELLNTDPEPGSTVVYTVDGSAPALGSPVFGQSGPVELVIPAADQPPIVVRAACVLSNGLMSRVVSTRIDPAGFGFNTLRAGLDRTGSPRAGAFKLDRQLRRSAAFDDEGLAAAAFAVDQHRFGGDGNLKRFTGGMQNELLGLFGAAPTASPAHTLAQLLELFRREGMVHLVADGGKEEQAMRSLLQLSGSQEADDAAERAMLFETAFRALASRRRNEMVEVADGTYQLRDKLQKVGKKHKSMVRSGSAVGAKASRASVQFLFQEGITLDDQEAQPPDWSGIPLPGQLL
jgi:hypothetical protein